VYLLVIVISLINSS